MFDIFAPTTDGPNRNSGVTCPDIHAGITEGIPDSCCKCCNPCLHATPPGRTPGRCCSCVPGMICFTFTLDAYQSTCCKSFSMFALAAFDGNGNAVYTADFRDFTVTLQVEHIHPAFPDSPCQWRLSSTHLYHDATYPINHAIGDCFRSPPFVLHGVSVGGCVGAITMSVYHPTKLPFHNAHPRDVEEIAIPYSPCHCNFAADRLCVGGVRHANGPVEYVNFQFDRDLGDRWTYWPQGMTYAEAYAAYLVEHIYLRGDVNGNCYLEFDSEQAGPSTNDFADPPNSYDANYPHAVRPGMMAIDFCGCGLSAQSGLLADGQRHIRIHAGDCGRWQYMCGKCRCIPPTLCFIAGFDGDMIRGAATWNGSEWVYDDGYISFQLRLSKGSHGDCVMNVTSNYLLPFQQSASVPCGNFLTSENSTAFDPAYPAKHAFIWTNGSACGGCGSTPRCGPCPDRCGGPPETLYLTVTEGVRDTNPYDMIDLHPFECVFHITMEFWDRSGLVPMCGYVGETYYTCQGVTYRLVAVMTSPGWLVTVNRYSTVDGSFVSSYTYPYDISHPNHCDPFQFSASVNPTGDGAYYTFSVIE